MKWFKFIDENGVFVLPPDTYKAVLVANKTIQCGFLRRERDQEFWSKDNFNNNDTHWAAVTLPMEEWEEVFEAGYARCPAYEKLPYPIKSVAKDWFKHGYTASKKGDLK